MKTKTVVEFSEEEIKKLINDAAEKATEKAIKKIRKEEKESLGEMLIKIGNDLKTKSAT